MTSSELRPLSLGELLDRTFSCYREHFLLFVGIMAVPQVFVVLLGALQLMFEQSALHSQANPQAMGQAMVMVASAGLGFLIMGIAYLLAYAAALGGTTFGVSEVYLGRSVTIGSAYRKIRGRLWRLVRVLVIIGFWIFLPFFVLGLSAAVFVPLGMAGRPPATAAVAAGIFVVMIVLLGIPWAVWMSLRYALAIPSLMLENLGARQAIKRSILLTKGYRGRIFLMALLMTLIALVAGIVLKGPFMIAMSILAMKSSALALWLAYPMAVAGGISGAVTGPLLTIAIVLAYYDTRVRKEGFDLQLMMSSLDNPPAPAMGLTQAAPPAVS